MDTSVPPSRLVVVLGLAALLAGSVRPARADEPDAATRFHDAYVQEVIEGEIGAAAKTYLDLVRDERTPSRLKAEARFRFGVCLVLLGRADEARARLEALATDEDVPVALRNRAKEYLEGIAGLGIGGELEKKLQELVFELARADPAKTPPVYRDVEVLGRTAIPFLKRLLAHEDEGLRQHAFRLLARMDVEGLGALWSPRIPFAGEAFGDDVRNYLRRKADERAPLEQTLLALDDETLEDQLERMSAARLPLSLAFADALARRIPAFAISFVPRTGWEEATWRLLAGWLDRGLPDLRRDALHLLLRHANDELPSPGTAAAIFPRIVSAAARSGWRWVTPQRRLGSPVPGLLRLTAEQPTAAVLAAVEAVHEVARDTDLSWDNPLWPGNLAARLQQPLAERETTREETATWERTWREGFEILLGIYEPGHAVHDHFRPLADLLRKLPRDRARSLLDWARRTAEGSTLGTPFFSWLPDLLPLETPADVETFVVALESAPDAAPAYARALGERSRTVSSHQEDLRAALFRAAPRIVRATSPRLLWSDYLRRLPWFAGAVPTGEGVDVLAATLRTVALPSGAPEAATDMGLFTPPPGEVTKGYHARVLVPAIARVWEDLGAADRDRVFGALTYAVDERRTQLEAEDEEAIAAFLQERVAALIPRYEKRLARRPDLFPPETWIPLASPDGIGHLSSLPPERRDEVARALVRDPAGINASVLRFVREQASRDVARDVFDRLLVSGDERLRGLVLEAVDLAGKPASLAAIEEALAHLLAAEDPDLEQLARAAHVVLNLDPSESLVPAAARLLRGDGRAAVLTGIELARSLAHPALLDELRPLLGSLDEKVRTGAQRAIEQIERLQADRPR